MIKTKRFNNIPEKKIPKMPKKPAVFKLIVQGDESNPSSYPNSFNITNQERVQIDGDIYEIAFIERIRSDADGNDVPVLGDIWLDRRNFGEVMCRPGRIQEEALYQYLMLHPWNASNPDRPEHEEPKFKLVNTEKEAKDRLDISREEITARARAINMEVKDVRMVAEYFGLDTRLKPSVLREKLEGIARKEPASFMEADSYVSREGKFLELVKKGKRHNVITMDGRNFKWKWAENKEVFTSGNPDVTVEQNDFKLAEWLRNNADGKKVATTLEKALEQFEGEYEI